MARQRPKALTYREVLIALHDAQLVIARVAAMPGVPHAAREALRLLAERLALLLIDRDGGRKR